VLTAMAFAADIDITPQRGVRLPRVARRESRGFLREFSFVLSQQVLPTLPRVMSPQRQAQAFRSAPWSQLQRLFPTFAFSGEVSALQSQLPKAPKALARPHLGPALTVTRRTQH
jgi:hypothetical protein